MKIEDQKDPEWIPVGIRGINDDNRECIDAPEIIVWYPTTLMPCFLVCFGAEPELMPEGRLITVMFSVFCYILDDTMSVVLIYE